jgi:hypothetical protein
VLPLLVTVTQTLFFVLTASLVGWIVGKGVLGSRVAKEAPTGRR